MTMPLRARFTSLSILASALLAVFASTGPGSAQTLKAVKDRGTLNCGVSEGLYGFSAPDDARNWNGFDVDFCRAVAAAIFNDAKKVTFTSLATADRLPALRSGKID